MIVYIQVYWVGPMAGAVLAGIFYWVFDTVDKPPSPDSYVTSSNGHDYSKQQGAYNDRVVYVQNGYRNR